MPRERTSLRADARLNRERILAAAAEVFAVNGLSATLHDVADHAGVGIGTVYRRFADKEELITALFEQKVDELVAVAEAAAAVKDPWEALVTLLETLTARAVADTGLQEILERQADDDFESARARLGVVLARVLGRGQRAGVIRADIETVDLAMIWRMLTEVARHLSTVRQDAWLRYVPLVAEGLRCDAGDHPLDIPALTPAEGRLMRSQRRSRVRGKAGR